MSNRFLIFKAKVVIYSGLRLLSWAYYGTWCYYYDDAMNECVIVFDL